jgi:uncharacterized protein (DUF305 family)
MIPHHAAAILKAENAKITDPEIKGLAEEIIRSQQGRLNK